MRVEGGSGSGQSQGRFCFLVMLEGAFLPKLSPPLAAPTGGSMRPSYCPQLPSPGSEGGRHRGSGFTTLKAASLSGTATDSDWQLPRGNGHSWETETMR